MSVNYTKTDAESRQEYPLTRALSADSKLCPTVTVGVKGGGGVTGEVRISKEQLKGLGKDFNSFVTKQMSGALSGEDESKNKNMKKGAKGKVQKK